MEKILVVKTLQDLEMSGKETEDFLFTLYSYWQNAIRTEDKINQGEVFYNDSDFFQGQFKGDIMEALQAIEKENYDVADPYIRYNDYMKIESTKYLSDFIDFDEMADFLVKNYKKIRTGDILKLEMRWFDITYKNIETDMYED